MQFANLNTMTKNQQARAIAKTEAAIEQAKHEAEQAAEQKKKEAIEAARERIIERIARKKMAEAEAKWKVERAKERVKADLWEEWQRLSDRYDAGFNRVRQFSDAAIRQFEQDAGTKAILNRMKEIDALYAAIK